MQKFKIRNYTEQVDFRNFNPLKASEAMHAKCLDCCVYNEKEVRLCENYDCPLHQFMLNDFKLRQQSEETKIKRAENMKKVRLNKE